MILVPRGGAVAGLFDKEAVLVQLETGDVEERRDSLCETIGEGESLCLGRLNVQVMDAHERFPPPAHALDLCRSPRRGEEVAPPRGHFGRRKDAAEGYVSVGREALLLLRGDRIRSVQGRGYKEEGGAATAIVSVSIVTVSVITSNGTGRSVRPICLHVFAESSVLCQMAAPGEYVARPGAKVHSGKPRPVARGAHMVDTRSLSIQSRRLRRHRPYLYRRR